MLKCSGVLYQKKAVHCDRPVSPDKYIYFLVKRGSYIMERESFKFRLGFILVSVGCVIGIGNVWRFPFIIGQNDYRYRRRVRLRSVVIEIGRASCRERV